MACITNLILELCFNTQVKLQPRPIRPKHQRAGVALNVISSSISNMAFRRNHHEDNLYIASLSSVAKSLPSVLWLGDLEVGTKTSSGHSSRNLLLI